MKHEIFDEEHKAWLYCRNCLKKIGIGDIEIAVGYINQHDDNNDFYSDTNSLFTFCNKCGLSLLEKIDICEEDIS